MKTLPLKPFTAALLAVSLLSGCTLSKVSIRESKEFPGQMVAVTKTCRATGGLQHNGVRSFHLVRDNIRDGVYWILPLSFVLAVAFLPIHAAGDLFFRPCTITEGSPNAPLHPNEKAGAVTPI